MSKVYSGAYQNGKVTFLGTPIEGAIIIGKGGQDSEGSVFFDEDRVVYFPKVQGDFEDTIDKVKEALDKIASVLQSIGAGMTGPTTAPPPTLVADLAELNAIGTQLEALKDVLR